MHDVVAPAGDRLGGCTAVRLSTGAAAAPGEAELLRHLWWLCDIIITSQFLIFRETIPNLRSHPHLSFSLHWVSLKLRRAS